MASPLAASLTAGSLKGFPFPIERFCYTGALLSWLEPDASAQRPNLTTGIKNAAYPKCQEKPAKKREAPAAQQGHLQSRQDAGQEVHGIGREGLSRRIAEGIPHHLQAARQGRRQASR